MQIIIVSIVDTVGQSMRQINFKAYQFQAQIFRTGYVRIVQNEIYFEIDSACPHVSGMLSEL